MLATDTDTTLFVPRFLWKYIVISLTLFAVLQTGAHVMEGLSGGRSLSQLDVPKYLVVQILGLYSFMIFLPVAFYCFNHYPVEKGRIVPRVLLHLGVAFGTGILHTTILYLQRSKLLPILGWGDTSVSVLTFRYLKELMGQFVAYGVFYGINYLVNSVMENQRQRIRTVQLEEQLTKARLQALQTQVNPHFLFNTLNLISSTMYTDAPLADKMISKLSDLLRITLDTTHKNLHLLKQELELTELYIGIMLERFKGKLTVSYAIDEESIDGLVPTFVFQPIVENSIKYAVERRTVAHIHIATAKHDGKLILKIEDNGPGIADAKTKILKKGIGINNTLQRLETIYGDGYEFFFENIEKGGLRTKITIPFQLAAETPYD